MPSWTESWQSPPPATGSNLDDAGRDRAPTHETSGFVDGRVASSGRLRRPPNYRARGNHAVHLALGALGGGACRPRPKAARGLCSDRYAVPDTSPGWPMASKLARYSPSSG